MPYTKSQHDNVIRIVQPQNSGEQELEATRQLAKTLEKIAADLRRSVKGLLHTHRLQRMERTNLSMQILFLDGQLNAEKQHLKKTYRLYKQAQNDLMAVKRAEKERRNILTNGF